MATTEKERTTTEAERTVPPAGTWASTARLMAEFYPEVDGDPDFWDRWKDEMKDRDMGVI